MLGCNLSISVIPEVCCFVDCLLSFDNRSNLGDGCVPNIPAPFEELLGGWRGGHSDPLKSACMGTNTNTFG